MSVMKFREPNQVLWRGFRPGHNGTQGGSHGEANNTEVDAYVNASGKVAFVTSINVGVLGGAVGLVEVIYTTNLNALINEISIIPIGTVGNDANQSISFPFPFEVGKDGKIRVRTNALGLKAYAVVIYWEE